MQHSVALFTPSNIWEIQIGEEGEEEGKGEKRKRKEEKDASIYFF